MVNHAQAPMRDALAKPLDTLMESHVGPHRPSSIRNKERHCRASTGVVAGQGEKLHNMRSTLSANSLSSCTVAGPQATPQDMKSHGDYNRITPPGEQTPTMTLQLTCHATLHRNIHCCARIPTSIVLLVAGHPRDIDGQHCEEPKSPFLRGVGDLVTTSCCSWQEHVAEKSNPCTTGNISAHGWHHVAAAEPARKETTATIGGGCRQSPVISPTCSLHGSNLTPQTSDNIPQPALIIGTPTEHSVCPHVGRAVSEHSWLEACRNRR